jgi:hypothetical protein
MVFISLEFQRVSGREFQRVSDKRVSGQTDKSFRRVSGQKSFKKSFRRRVSGQEAVKN